jgi:hypothetical protein
LNRAGRDDGRRAIHSPAGPAPVGVKSAEGGGSRGNHGFTRARINAPRPALVEAGPAGTPVRVNRQDVALMREEWRVVDRWWTEEPVSRRYFDVVLETGQNAVVFRDEEVGCWFSQKA